MNTFKDEVSQREFKKQQYMKFVEGKIIQTPSFGTEIDKSLIHSILKPHQADIVHWGIEGGRRAIFAAFGLGKTLMQLELARLIVDLTNKSFLIGMPLGVKQEFFEDAELLDIEIYYVKDQEEVEDLVDFYESEEAAEYAAPQPKIFISNYERIREGNFNPSYFGGVSFDEGDAIRNLSTETTDYIMNNFNVVPYRFIATATPSPNDYTEILNYAQFLGVMDRSQALTRFFQRNSTKAGDLTVYPHKEVEFWIWVKSWAVIIQKPSDLGYSDEGYDLPPLLIHYREVKVKERAPVVDRDGNLLMYPNTSKGLLEANKEKRDSMPFRVEESMNIIKENPNDNFIIWHHREDERKLIEKLLPEAKSVYGSQNWEEREENLIGFKNGKYQYLSTKPEIAGSGCNFQKHCHKAIFVGIDYRFKDFIQAIHRILRFLQKDQVEIYIIYSDAEVGVLKVLQKKWHNHNELVAKQSRLIRQYGLSSTKLVSELKRTIGVERQEASGELYQVINNDAVLETIDMPDNSIDLIVTSIPFSDQYEYCESYHDMGHNDGNGEFFEQLDFLTSELLRVLRPGRIAAIHVKDRIRFSYQNGVGFTSLIDFPAHTYMHFEKHGFYLLGKHFITTDVAAENAQTYRLGWTEQCKDGTKMGSGTPEMVLVFRKKPTDTSNAYADVPVLKSKEDYSRGRWQLDAHAFWKSSGNRLLNPEELRKLDLKQVGKLWKEFDLGEIYDYETHVKLCEELDNQGKLPATFMAVPPHSNTDSIWDNINRMKTLNASQRLNKKEKHVCPLQFDTIDRLIVRYSNQGEKVFDPFGGIMSVPYRAIILKRIGIAAELNIDYWKDGKFYCKQAEYKKEAPTLFDTLA